MKINIKFTNIEKRIFRRLLSIALFVYLFTTCALAITYLGDEYGLKGGRYLLAGFIIVVPMWITSIAIFKYYR